MVRRTGLAIAALFAAALAGRLDAQQPTAAAQPPLRLAFINSQLILANTPGRAEAESLFTREMAGYRAEVQGLQTRLDSAVAEYQRTSVALTPAARQARETEIRNLQQRAQQRASELDQQASQREAQLTAPIMRRVNAVIEGIRAEFNYAMIFDAAATGGALVTADQSLDISPLVIERLRAAGPAPAVSDSGVVQPGGQPPITAPAQQAPAQRPAARPAARPAQRPAAPPPSTQRQ
ncbi:MAG: OmpH family outer membrane protein [Gemmatimonadales bacterium]